MGSRAIKQPCTRTSLSDSSSWPGINTDQREWPVSQWLPTETAIYIVWFRWRQRHHRCHTHGSSVLMPPDENRIGMYYANEKRRGTTVGWKDKGREKPDSKVVKRLHRSLQRIIHVLLHALGMGPLRLGDGCALLLGGFVGLSPNSVSPHRTTICETHLDPRKPWLAGVVLLRPLRIRSARLGGLNAAVAALQDQGHGLVVIIVLWLD